MDRDYRHPERHIEGMVLFPKNQLPSERTKSQGDILKQVNCVIDSAEDLKIELCRSCGWNVKHECMSSYVSRLRVMYTRANKGLWLLGGSQWILIDEPNNPDTLGNDFMTQEFLRNQPDCNIPILKEMRCISQPTDQTRFILMSRAEGVTLRSIWHTLSQDEKLSYSRQVTEVLRELRKYTSPVAQKVDGTPLDDTAIGVCSDLLPCCKKIGSTGEDWIDNISEELRHGLARRHETNDPVVIEEKLGQIRQRFPNQGPYVLTHGDLHAGNIMVKDGKIEAIIDWELAGYYPWWFEYYRSYIVSDRVKEELFDPIWHSFPDLTRGMNQDEYSAYMGPIAEVMGLYQLCRTEHPNHDGNWRRPAFCDCRPFGGRIHLRDLGEPTGHRIDGKGHDPEGDARRVAESNKFLKEARAEQQGSNKSAWSLW